MGRKRRRQGSLAEEIAGGFSAEQERTREAGLVDGAHYTEYVDGVKQLKREKRHAEAIALLDELVEANEAKSKAAGEGRGVAPWYYEQLAIIYRKEKGFSDEVAILECYQAQPKAPGAGPNMLAERLAMARELAVAAKT